MKPYRVTEQYERDRSDRPIADFENLNHAKAFVEQVLLPPAVKLGTHVVYRVLKNFDLIEEYDSKKIDPATLSSNESSSQGAGKSSTSSFRPTPFNTSPSPGGVAKKWIQDNKDDDKEEK